MSASEWLEFYPTILPYTFIISSEPTITLALQSPDKKKSKKSVGSIAFRVIVSAPDVVAPGMDDGLAEVETSLVNMDFMSQAGSTALESEPGPWVDLIKCLKDFDATPIVKALDAVAEVDILPLSHLLTT